MGAFKTIKGYETVGRWPRLGKIHLGVKKKSANGAEYPVEVPHFVFDESTPPGKAALKLYGPAPRVIDVALPAPDVHDCAPTAFKKYAGGNLICTGDGEAYRRWGQQGENGKWLADGPETVGRCPSPETCPFARDGKGKVTCKAVMNLYVILYRVSVAGVFQIDTGSWHSHQGIYNGARFLQDRFPERPLHQIPLKLCRVAQEIEYEGKRSTHYILQLRLPNHEEIPALVEGLYRTRIAVEAALGSPRLALAGSAVDPLPRAALPAPPRTEIEEDLFPAAPTERVVAGGGAVETNGDEALPDGVGPGGEVVDEDKAAQSVPAEPGEYVTPPPPKSRLMERVEAAAQSSQQAVAPTELFAPPEAPTTEKPKRHRRTKEEMTAAAQAQAAPAAPVAPAAPHPPLPVTPGPSPDDPQYSFE